MDESQHSLLWFRQRLGNFTGSRVGVLTGRKRGSDEFNDTALAYVYETAATRYMNNKIVEDDDLFADYLELTNFETRAMAWGTEQEANARRMYAKMKGVEVEEVGFIEHETIPFFGSSPDGRIAKDKDGKRGSIEIKCPKQATYLRYRAEVHDNTTLKAVNKEYYYQCLSHMMCDKTEYTDFIVYNPFQAKPIHIVRILPDEDEFKLIEECVNKANAIIETLK